MLVQHKFSTDERVYQTQSVKKLLGKDISFRILIERLAQKLMHILNPHNELISPQIWAPSSLASEINALNPDIVHIHWTQSGFLMPEDIPKIKAPIVWTARDMWLVTNGAHYCAETNTRSVNTTQSILWKRKQKAFAQKPNITFVAISQWLLSVLQQSPLLKEHKCLCIPNGVPADIFKKVDLAKHAELLNELNLDPSKRYILFGAQQATQDKRKGFHHLQALLEKNELPDNAHVLIFGANEDQTHQTHSSSAHQSYLGYLDREQLAKYYQACDLTLVPSEQEGFGKVAAESIMCGTPVVSFDIHGLKDIVTNQKNGWRAKPFDHKDLAKGIMWCLNEDLKTKMQTQNYDFSAETMAKTYIELYNTMAA